MKILRICIIALFFICCSETTKSSLDYSYTWPIKSDSTNIAILVLDYESYIIEGGYFNTYKICHNCDSLLPFNITVQQPLDFGHITFTYKQTNDTIFMASVVWRGLGSISYPSNFLPADTFKLTNNAIPKPDSLELFEYFIDMDKSKLKAKSDTVWFEIDNLDIVVDFSQEFYSAGIFLYPASVGGFDPGQAKWIVFLCR